MMEERAAAVEPAMPDDLFHPLLVQRFMDEMQSADRDAEGSLDRSLVVQFGVRRVPPKPHWSQKLEDEHPEVAAKVKEHRWGMEDLVPELLCEDDCGTNHGWCTILRRRYEQKLMADDRCSQYDIIYSDVALYHRVLKVTHCTRARLLSHGRTMS